MYDFYYFYQYSVVAGIALAIHLIINWRQLVAWRTPVQSRRAREFRRFSACLLAFFASDFLWGVLAGQKCRNLLYADTVAFFALMALSVFTWTRFFVAYLEMSGRARAWLLGTGRATLAFFAAALAANPFTDAFFAVGAGCEYSEGPLRDIALGLLIAINALGSAITLHGLVRAEGAARRRNAMVSVFGAVMVAAIALQLGDPLLPMYSLGCMFGCCFLHVFVVEDERDAMHRKELLAHSLEARLEAERAANRAKSLFFSSVSHDIRTPLNAILGFSELLEQGVPGEEERIRYTSSIRSSGKVLARLVDDVLDLSKLECGKLEICNEPTDVPALVREVIAACEIARARKSLALKTSIDDMPAVSLDPQRLRQILFNLLSNAYKFTARGTISVCVRWRGGTLEISVSDTGIGISKDDIARILQPFVQVVDRNNRSGTGLGLPICNKLATLMGGKLEIDSEPGKGSTFTVSFRGIETAELPEPRTAATNAAPPPPPARPPSRVLVVDDSPVNRMVLKAMLAKCGIVSVATAENGLQALEILKHDPEIDLVLTDLWMPEMDGGGLVAAIRADAKLAGLPVYLVTADVEAPKDGESDGFTGILLKPVSIASLAPLFAQTPAPAPTSAARS